MAEYRMFLDDERDPPNDGPWVVVRDFRTAVDVFNTHGCPTHISFDHDLGSELTGFDVAKELIDLDMDTTITIPENFTYYVHSQNPVGRDNITGLLDSYLKFKKEWHNG